MQEPINYLKYSPLLVIFALLYFKPNRKIQALPVIIPLLAIYLILFLFEQISNFTFDDLFYPLIQIILSIVFALTVIWLQGHQINHLRRLFSFLITFIIIATVSIINFTYQNYFYDLSITDLIILGLISLTLSFGLTIVPLIIGKKNSITSLMFKILIWFIISPFIYLSFIFLISLLRDSYMIQWIFPGFGLIFIFSVVSGSILYIILLPFMILTFKNKFYRNRMSNIFKISNSQKSDRINTTLHLNTK